MSTDVSFENITKAFGKFEALKNLSFSIKKGELYGLIGPNGAGKTTAIKILTGLLKATAGKVSVLGFAPQDPRLLPLMGYMPQETALYIDLTTRENLDLFGRLYGIDKNERRKRIDELLEFTGLEEWADITIAQLSGGMRHKASLAVALLPHPQLLVLDEPTVGVDPELRVAFWERFQSMQKQGTTILLTTHYMDEALKCERVGLLNHGHLIADGSSEELMKQSKTNNLEEAFLSLSQKKAGIIYEAITH